MWTSRQHEKELLNSALDHGRADLVAVIAQELRGLLGCPGRTDIQHVRNVDFRHDPGELRRHCESRKFSACRFGLTHLGPPDRARRCIPRTTWHCPAA